MCFCTALNCPEPHIPSVLSSPPSLEQDEEEDEEPGAVELPESQPMLLLLLHGSDPLLSAEAFLSEDGIPVHL